MAKAAHWTLLASKPTPQNIEEARERLAEVQQASATMVLILTVEQAIKARRVVKEAGRRHG